ncbi:uncharacterized protein DFL_003241 [Arthrobotrys flagrans]|uniref:F-box domain-containing protein n=1 Tax=Arthrobotrys flagrans TaxID=97331 RepID=A0A437A106_ARTFL|nr:hypothetical protein DFL_003241 [Arthrobotrys flagrans]
MHVRLRMGSRKIASAKGKQPQTTSSIFLIHEILEGILLEVPAIDLILNCRGVCKTWKDLIEVTSPDLKYYSLSGLRRPSTISNGERKKPETLPSAHEPPPHNTTKPTQILTPLAVDILGIFWKRFAKKIVTTKKDRPAEQERESLHLGRKFYKAMHCGMRSYDSSRESGVVYTTTIFVLYCIIVPIGTPIYQFYDKVLRPMSPTHMKQRRFKRTSIRLIKEFQPIWQKIQIFHPQDSKPPVVNIGAHTNWRSREEWWDYDFELGATFSGLPDAALALMTPLIEAAYGNQPIKPDPAMLSTDPYATPTVVIDLRHRVDIDHAHRYVDYTPREVIIFGGHRPFDVSRDFRRPPNVGYARVSDKTVRY